MSSVPQTEYAVTSDGVSVAYQLLSDSGPNLVWVTGTASHIEHFWEIPGWSSTMRRIAGYSRCVWFDKRGTGLSDRVVASPALEGRIADIAAVMDATGMRSATLVGASEGAMMSALFAALHPERVERLVLIAGWPHDVDGSRIEAYADLMEAHWGSGRLLEYSWAKGMDDRELLARIERAMGSPRSMAAIVRANARIDVRPALGLVQCPTLVLHADRDPIIPVEMGRRLAALVPGARLEVVSGDFHASARPAEMDVYGDHLEEFVRGTTVVGTGATRVLSTVLFTDIVDSTAHAAARGDARWRAVLDEHDAIAGRVVVQGGGRLVKSTGDGLLATFDGPASAVRAAHLLSRRADLLGLQVRAGVHTGEVELRGEDVAGAAVHLAARLCGVAAAGEVLVSATVPGLAVGSGLLFAPRGEQLLKGFAEPQQVFAASAG